jgi:hypothetical protein
MRKIAFTLIIGSIGSALGGGVAMAREGGRSAREVVVRHHEAPRREIVRERLREREREILRVPAYAPPRAVYEGAVGLRGFVWVEGEYDWVDGQYIWIPGHYERERVGYSWEATSWSRGEGGHFVKNPGRWIRR